MIGQVLAATIGTIAFSVLYSVPREYYPHCGFVGGAGWMVYCFLIPHATAPEATMIAAILVVFLSRLFAVWEKCPVTIFFDQWDLPVGAGRRCLLDSVLYRDQSGGTGRSDWIYGA